MKKARSRRAADCSVVAHAPVDPDPPWRSCVDSCPYLIDADPEGLVHLWPAPAAAAAEAALAGPAGGTSASAGGPQAPARAASLPGRVAAAAAVAPSAVGLSLRTLMMRRRKMWSSRVSRHQALRSNQTLRLSSTSARPAPLVCISTRRRCLQRRRRRRRRSLMTAPPARKTAGRRRAAGPTDLQLLPRPAGKVR
jgi:hypothetical protein